MSRRALIAGTVVTLVHFAMTLFCMHVASSHDWPTSGPGYFFGYALFGVLLAPVIFIPSLLESDFGFVFIILNSLLWGMCVALMWKRAEACTRKTT